jgi:hypothetical protein
MNATPSDGEHAGTASADPNARSGSAGARQTIVCHPVNLLGNVLRAAASDKILADAIGADFAISIPWSCHPTVRVALDMLFRAYLTPARLPARKVEETALMTFPGIYGTNSDPVQEAVFVPAEALPREDFWALHIYAAVPHGMSTAEYVRRKVAFYASLPVAPALRDAVDAFAARRGLGGAVGVHIRHTDNLNDAAKRDRQLNTPLPAFVAKVDELVASGRRILLCSDNPTVLRDLSRRVPPRSLVLADAAPTPPLQALYEMLLLSRTSRIVGSYASTFSYEACFFRGIDLECFEGGQWRRYPIAALAAAAAPASAPRTAGSPAAT